MKTPLKLTTMALALFAAGSAQATPFTPDEVPAKANWFAHADLDTLRGTKIGSQIVAKIEDEHGAQLRAVKRMFSLNPVTDLQGITLWGTGEKDKGAVIIRGEFDPEHLTDLIAGAQDYESWEHEGTTIHTWRDEKKDEIQFGSFPSSNVVVISGQKSFVIETVDVFGGRADALESGFESSETVFALGVANLEEMDVEGEESQMLEKAKTLRLRLFEDSEQMHAELTVEVLENQHATRLKRVLEGIIALGELSNDELAGMKLDSKVSVSDGTTVTASLSVPHDKMMKLLELDKMFE